MAVVRASVVAQLIREGMDEYWRVIYAPSENGMSEMEIGWRRQHERDMKRLEEKLGPEFEAHFKEKA